MKKELERTYQEQETKKKKLSNLKNKYLGIIYKGVISKQTTRQIHKALYDATINKKVFSKQMLKYAIKLANKAKKLDNGEKRDVVAGLVIPVLLANKAEKIINTELRHQTDKAKKEIIRDYIKDNRAKGKWFYLASSHNDCAKDHLPYQGKIYVDEKAPDELKAGYKTIQWVMDAPAYFITRPNCRHFFVAMESPKDAKKINAHSDEGDRDFSTPPREAVKEYEARLATLRTLYAQHPTEKLKRMIEKTELLLKKWKKLV